MPLSDIQTLQNTVDAVRKKMKIEFPQDKMYIYDLMRSMNVIPGIYFRHDLFLHGLLRWEVS
jgi:hypothetical protein